MSNYSYVKPYLLIFIFVVFVITACITKGSPQENASPQGTPEPITSLSPSLVIPTSAPTSTAKPKPVYDLYDPAGWPLEMHDYFYREPSEWNHPTKRYVVHSEFDEFLQDARRTFMETQGLTEIAPQNKSQPFYEQQLFLEYIRWGMENKQVIILSPKEIISLLVDSRNEDFGYCYFTEGTKDRKCTGGIYVEMSISRAENGTFFLHGDKRNTFTLEELLNYMDREDEPPFTIDVFGTSVEIPRNTYKGITGDLAGIFLLPGIDPEDGVGLLFHFITDSGEHRWYPIATHFVEINVAIGELVSPCWNGQYLKVMPATQAATVFGAHFGVPGAYGNSPILLKDMLELIGSMLTAYPDAYPDMQIVGPIPWQLGLEPAERFYTVDEQWMKAPHFPWESVPEQ